MKNFMKFSDIFGNGDFNYMNKLVKIKPVPITVWALDKIVRTFLLILATTTRVE